MGTDIHIVAQIQGEDGIWRDVDTSGVELENRSYTWFTFLDGTRADVTNDKRQIGIVPVVTDRRGAPADFEEHPASDAFDNADFYHGEKWMGYGVCNWATLGEIIAGEKRQPKPLPTFPEDVRVGPIDELERIFAGHDPNRCRIVWGYDT